MRGEFPSNTGTPHAPGRYLLPMITLDTLDTAAAGSSAVLDQVGDDQWSLPTPNDGQNVRQLVDHVIGGNRMSAAILHGGTRDDGLAAFALSASDTDVVAAFADSRQQQAAAFAEPEALERLVAHPAMTMPGAQLLGFRTTEYALHGWDLARAIGVDDQIDPGVLQGLLEQLEPLAPMLAASGLKCDTPPASLAFSDDEMVVERRAAP